MWSCFWSIPMFINTNPLLVHYNISMSFLHTVPYTFLAEQIIFFMLKSFCANDNILNSYEFCVWLNSDTEGRYKIPLTPTFCSVQVTDQKNNTTLPFDVRNGKISTQPHTILCIQFLDRQNNDKNNTRPLRKQICFTIVWGYVEILPKK